VTVIAWIGTAVGAAAVLLAAAKLIRDLLSGVRRVSHFFDDWFGEPERDGVPERPGVMRRLEKIEYQVFPNSGNSLFDRVGQQGNAIEDLTKRIDQLIDGG
jgi:hypothetical protein